MTGDAPFEPMVPFLTVLGPAEEVGQGFSLLCGHYAVERFWPECFAELGVELPAPLHLAAPRRQAEYLAGRAVAGWLLQAVGAGPAQVGYGADRLPIWPAGYRGSISHARGHVVSLARRGADHHAGVDVEALLTGKSLSAVLRKAVLAADLAQLAGEVTAADATAIFSAKEALFKALYPMVQRWFGFEAAELAAPPAEDRLLLRLTGDLTGDLRAGQVFDVHLRRRADHVISWVIVPARP